MAEPRVNGHDKEPDQPDVWISRVIYEYETRPPHDPGLEQRMDALRRAIEEQGEKLRQTLREEAEQNRDRSQRDAAYVGSKIERAGKEMAQAESQQTSSLAREIADDRALLGRMIADMGKNIGHGASRAAQRFRDRDYATHETRYTNGVLAYKHFQGMSWANPNRAEMKALKKEYKADKKAQRQAWKQERQNLSMWQKYGPGSSRHKEAFHRGWQEQRLDNDHQNTYKKYGSKGNGIKPPGHDHDGHGR